ncbi:triphosphoribosyl-dephospho-CoA synthase [Variovorax sp. J2P1-59]|uniref:triphosphoribosyl-dephospho-CoA synthase n=1 Tax=Variovorax flavidus TaxID=3053501 RepID=UPI00257696AA|nr:triphosphoribosyl-dephospho-CoA synthase [Variovorax sp. J2P1-59]MDM0073251.1 triphosphoribosyl-dephospho-CoA synthase [Variovorax sp. J2P1-59]
MPVTEMRQCATDRARACFLRACELDVAVRKPGNVSRASAGHGMTADAFVASAEAAAGPLFERGTSVGERIEAAVEATWAVAGCNTNLGIVLLCAPIARAIELRPDASSPAELQDAIESVLGALDLSDAQAAFRAIARARPGGLGTAADQDVRHAPSMDLRAAMALAAHRDSIAGLYRDGYGALFDLGVPTLGTGFSLKTTRVGGPPDAATVAAVQRLYLALLSSVADSHIVRIHGDAVAHIVMTAAQGWRVRERCRGGLDADPDFAAWDASLKADGINPGTTADLTVATLLIAGLASPSRPAAGWSGPGGTDRDT